MRRSGEVFVISKVATVDQQLADRANERTSGDRISDADYYLMLSYILRAAGLTKVSIVPNEG
jgi:hypothetical protein